MRIRFKTTSQLMNERKEWHKTFIIFPRRYGEHIYFLTSMMRRAISISYGDIFNSVVYDYVPIDEYAKLKLLNDKRLT